MHVNNRGYTDTGYIKYLTIQEFQRITQYINKLRSPPMKMLLRLMLYTGIPTIDAIQLQRSHFDRSFTYACITRQKTSRPYDLILPNFLSQELERYYKKYCKRMKQDYLFFANYSNQSHNLHIQASSIRSVFVTLRRKLGLDQTYYTTKGGMRLHRVTPHTLRHFAAWRFYEAGGKCLKTAQEMLNHSKPETTARYINALGSANNRNEIIEKAFTF